MVTLSKDFINVKGDQKLATQFKVTSTPSIVVVDPDGDEILRAMFTDETSLKKAMEDALRKYGPRDISWTDQPSGTKPVVLVFADDKKESEEQLKALADRALVKLQDKFEFVKAGYAKDDDNVKRWGVLQAPTIVIYDPSKEQDKQVLEKLSGKKSVREVKSAFLKALKKAG